MAHKEKKSQNATLVSLETKKGFKDCLIINAWKGAAEALMQFTLYYKCNMKVIDTGSTNESESGGELTLYVTLSKNGKLFTNYAYTVAEKYINNNS